jgi:cytochrome c peroxidase
MSKAFVTVFFTSIVVFCLSFATKPEGKDPANAAALGKVLFHDTILSSDYSISCASCHIPEFGFADTVAFSRGVGGRKTTRNSPTVMNVLARPLFFWDGRVETLEEQALHPISNPDEMNLPIEEAIKRLNESPYYKKHFKAIFGELPNKSNLGKAIAAFENTLETSSTHFDRYIEDIDSFTESEKRGHEIFNEKGKCFDCHFGPDFTGDEFRNIGLFNGEELNDSGRYKITLNKKDIGTFKVPGLRNIAVTAPYMHNGMFKTLREVIDYYDTPDAFISNSINRDTLLQKPLGLTEQEKQDLEAFLHTLTDDRFKN